MKWVASMRMIAGSYVEITEFDKRGYPSRIQMGYGGASQSEIQYEFSREGCLKKVQRGDSIEFEGSAFCGNWDTLTYHWGAVVANARDYYHPKLMISDGAGHSNFEGIPHLYGIYKYDHTWRLVNLKTQYQTYVIRWTGEGCEVDVMWDYRVRAHLQVLFNENGLPEECWLTNKKGTRRRRLLFRYEYEYR